MLKRRRTPRTLVRVARMLQELVACTHPSARAAGTRPTGRVALGRAA
jgi:hypothetical protein